MQTKQKQKKWRWIHVVIVVSISLLVGLSVKNWIIPSEGTQIMLTRVPGSDSPGAAYARVIASDPGQDTAQEACAQLRGDDDQPLMCREGKSFPSAGNAICGQFHPEAQKVKGKKGASYDFFCAAGSTKSGVCEKSKVDTCQTCLECSQELTCETSLSSSGHFADEVFVQCFPSSVPNFLQLENRFFVEVSGSQTLETTCAAFGKKALGYPASSENIGKLFYQKFPAEISVNGTDASYSCKKGSEPSSPQAVQPACRGTTYDVIRTCPACAQNLATDKAPGNLYSSIFGECSQDSGTAPSPELGKPLQRTDASGYVDYSFSVFHPAARDVKALIEVSENGGLTWKKASIVSASIGTGQADVSPDQGYQIGSSDPIDTSTGQAVTVNFIWDSKADGFLETTTAKIRVITVDVPNNNRTEVQTSAFQIDNVPRVVAVPPKESDVGSAETVAEALVPQAETMTAQEEPEIPALPSGSKKAEQPLSTVLPEPNEQVYGAAPEDLPIITLGTAGDPLEFLQKLREEKQAGEKISRQFATHLAIEILRIAGKATQEIIDDQATTLYPDLVGLDEISAKEISLATALGIVRGFPDRTFRPEQFVTNAEAYQIILEMQKFLNRDLTQQLQAQKEFPTHLWFQKYVNVLEEYGIEVVRGYFRLGSSIDFRDYVSLIIGISRPR